MLHKLSLPKKAVHFSPAGISRTLIMRNLSQWNILDFEIQKAFGEHPVSRTLKKLSQHKGQNSSLGCCSVLEGTEIRYALS